MKKAEMKMRPFKAVKKRPIILVECIDSKDKFFLQCR